MTDEEGRDRDERRFAPDADERLAGFEAEDVDVEEDLASEEVFDTQHSEGHTFNPHQADEQGLTYTPPSDPPVRRVEDGPGGVEVASGFATSMEDTDPSRRKLPGQVEGNDADVAQNVEQALRYNSETMHLSKVKVQVEEGIVTLYGTVPSEDDIGLVYEIVYGMNGVMDVHNDLGTEQ
jgi:hypothetical protein